MPILNLDKNNYFDITEINRVISDLEEDFLSENFNVETSIPKCLPIRKGTFFIGHGFTQDEQEPEILGSVILSENKYKFITNEENENISLDLKKEGYVFVAEIYTATENNIAHIGVEAIYFVESKIAENARGFGWE